MGLQSLPLQLIKHLANTTSVASSPAGPVGCYPLLDNISPIEPTVTNWDISYTNSQLKCVIADVTGK